jgi:diketogulonate reductase-like aldo/keto reductase
MALGSRAGAFVVPILGAKSRKHLEGDVRAADIGLTNNDLAEIDRIVPPGAASGTRYPIVADTGLRCAAALGRRQRTLKK